MGIAAADRRFVSCGTDLRTLPVTTLQGEPTTLGELIGGRAALVVNVASRCGLTPQYTQLEQLQREHGDRGFTVVGVPCNQFAGQEPGTAAEIEQFCSATYGVTFPMTAKVEVNGPDADPLFQALTAVPDVAGDTGDVQWNVEKWLLSADGEVVGRFRPRTEPTDPEVLAAIEAELTTYVAARRTVARDRSGAPPPRPAPDQGPPSTEDTA